jgi:hypothetical protein
VIEVGRGTLVDRSRMFMTWTDTSDSVDIKVLAFSTYNIQPGTWEFDTNDGKSILKETEIFPRVYINFCKKIFLCMKYKVRPIYVSYGRHKNLHRFLFLKARAQSH